MKVSKLWLSEWVNFQLDAEQLAAALTMGGLEVDAITPVTSPFDGVMIGQIISVSFDPESDSLQCEVDVGSNPISLKSQAVNIRPGLKVACAPAGANLSEGKLAQAKLCTLMDLGLGEMSEQILELDEKAPIGEAIWDYLSLDDQILDIDLTPNRADCLSVRGIARELAALENLKIKKVPQPSIKLQTDEKMTIKLPAREACPSYCGRIIRNINSQAQTPLWMRERLQRVGLRSIHPVVDVTNYVMLELGQPLHAFDLAAVHGDIEVRFAKPNETLILLDGQQVSLPNKVLVIADSEKALAMAGIIGGKASAVRDSTCDIFLESPFFNPLAIAGIARNFGLFTDASQRFERGVDPALTLTALEYATSLLLDIVGGEAGPVSQVTDLPNLPNKATIVFDPTKVKKLSGLDIPQKEMLRMLQNLGMEIDNQTEQWRVTVPSHRFDIQLDVDLIEEIIRLYGYDKITATKMITPLQKGSTNPLEVLSRRIADFLVARGYRETISYSFVDPELQQVLYSNTHAMELINPLSSELSQMRIGMWPGLLASMIYNINRQQTALKFFESGVIFAGDEDGKVQEHECIAGLMTGEQNALDWNEKARKFDFYDAKGDLQALFSLLQIAGIDFLGETHPALHPGKSAQLVHEGAVIGWCGILHPQIAAALELSDEVILFELRLTPLLSNTRAHYCPIAKFPQNRRDLSFLVNKEISASQIEATVRQAVKNNCLKSFEVFDVYTGKTIPEGKKSLAIALTLQNDERTMIDAEINAIIDAIIVKLTKEFSIILRE